MKGFASIEKDGHAGELGSTGILIGDVKFQVRLSMSIQPYGSIWQLMQCQQAVHIALRPTQAALDGGAFVHNSTWHAVP